jgi:hypothetical protein
MGQVMLDKTVNMTPINQQILPLSFGTYAYPNYSFYS